MLDAKQANALYSADEVDGQHANDLE